MPRIQILFCSGVCLLICSSAAAQSLPKNPTTKQIANYQVYQQKKWNYDQLPKRSIQYRSDPRYIPLSDKRVSSSRLNLSPVKTPEVKKNFSGQYFPLHNQSKLYLQDSRFLKYMWPHQYKEQSFQSNLSHSL